MRKSRLYYIIPLMIIVVGAAIMWVLIQAREEPAKRAPAAREKIVSTQVVAPGLLTAEVVAFGRVASRQPIDLISDVSGTLLMGDVDFIPGQSFRRGDLLVRIDDRQLRLRINSRKSELLNALGQVMPEIKIAFPSEYEVWADYFAACTFDTALSELPTAANNQIRLYLARFNVYQLYFAIKEMEIELEYHSQIATFDGSVVSTDLRVGSFVRQGARLGNIVNREELEVEIPVAVEDAGWIDHARPVLFSSRDLPGEWEGRITRVGSEIDTRTQSLQLFVSLEDNEGARLPNGTFLTARLPGRTIENGVKVPLPALYEDRYVYVISEGQLQQRLVTIARRQPGFVIINRGLGRGDTLVVEQLQGVVPGMKAASRAQAGEG